MVSERRHARQKLQSLEYVEIGREGDGNGGFLLDLSEDGAAVQMAHPAPLDDEVQLRFSLGAAGHVQTRGRIIWRDKAGKALGICFTDLDDPTRVRITKWLAESEGVPNYEWSVPSASTAAPLKQHSGGPTQSAATRTDQALEGAAPGEARLINVATAPHQIHDTAIQPAPVATEPTARFVSVLPENRVTRLIHRDRRDRPVPGIRPAESPSRLNTANHPDTSGPVAAKPASSLANTEANVIASVRRDPLATNNRPASTPYFSNDREPDGATEAVPKPALGVPAIGGGRSLLFESLGLGGTGSLGGANRKQPVGKRSLLQGVVVAGLPVLIILLALGYSMIHARKASIPAPGFSSQSSQLPSSPGTNANAAVANSPPPGERQLPGTTSSTTDTDGNTHSGAPSPPAHSPYDEFSSLYPAPLGPSNGTSSAPSGTPAPYASAPPSSSVVSRPPAAGGSLPAGKELSSKLSTGKQSATGVSPVRTTLSPSASGADSAAAAQGATDADTSAGPQPGYREYSFGMQSLQGKGDTPGSAAAATYFWAAVTDGNIPAEVALAQLYLRGDGVPKNCDQARVLLSSAASRGNADAPRILALLPSFGCESPASRR